MNKTKIEWCDYSWNPIKGACPVGCWYCYARAIYDRFKLNPEPRLDVDELEKLASFRKTGVKVFACSTFELFHPCVDGWRDFIFDAIFDRPDLTFIVLTKMPERIDRAMPNNVWLGASYSGHGDWRRLNDLQRAEAGIKFVSIEPILDRDGGVALEGFVDWVIVGRLTGYGNKYDPRPELVYNIIEDSQMRGTPLFLKDNLIPIVGKETVMAHREFPSGGRAT